MVKKIGAALGLVTAIIFIVASLYAYDCRVAKQTQLLALELRFDQKVMRDDMFYLRKQIRELEKEYRNNPMPPAVRDTYLDMKYQLKTLEDAVKNLKKKGG